MDKDDIIYIHNAAKNTSRLSSFLKCREEEPAFRSPWQVSVSRAGQKQLRVICLSPEHEHLLNFCGLIVFSIAYQKVLLFQPLKRVKSLADREPIRKGAGNILPLTHLASTWSNASWVLLMVPRDGPAQQLTHTELAHIDSESGMELI